jgi:hypothetical protein
LPLATEGTQELYEFLSPAEIKEIKEIFQPQIIYDHALGFAACYRRDARITRITRIILNHRDKFKRIKQIIVALLLRFGCA